MSHRAISFAPDPHPGPSPSSPDEPIDPAQLAELNQDGRMGRQIRDRLTGGEGGTR